MFEFGKKVSTTAIPNWPFENRPDWSLAKHCVGDMLYVREAWRTLTQLDSSSPSKITSDCLEAGYKKAWCPIKYLANDFCVHAYEMDNAGEINGKFRQGMHMPRWASRITLKVTDVRVERLQDISEADAIAEGCRPFFDDKNTEHVKSPNGNTMEMMPLKGPLDSFKDLWDSINATRNDGIYAWDKTPWVAAYTFEPIFQNVDQIGGE